MDRYSVSEYLNADLNVCKIVRIYESRSSYWSRPERLEREYEGLLYFVSGAIRYDLEGRVFEGEESAV